MDNLIEDTIIPVVLFLQSIDIYSLYLVSKRTYKMFSTDFVWTELGKRDYPILGIKNGEEYITKNPMFVGKKELEKYIENNSWAKVWISKVQINANGVLDHRFQAYVESIGSDIIRVEHYNMLRNKFPNGDMDWKIGINIIIDNLLTRTEEESKELENILFN